MPLKKKMPAASAPPTEQPLERDDEPSRSVPVDGARTTSLPSLLRRKKDEPPLPLAEVQGKQHRSAAGDTFLSLEDYEGVREILHPGRTREELDARTDLNVRQIVVFSKARVLAKRFGIRYLDDYVTHIERLSLSKGRKSRLEHVRALSGVVQQDQQAQNLLQKLG